MVIGCVGIMLIQTRSRLLVVLLARLMRLLFSEFILSIEMSNNLRDLLLQSVHRNAGGIVPPSVPPGGEGHNISKETDKLHSCMVGKLDPRPRQW